jgi:hypothetical protein
MVDRFRRRGDREPSRLLQLGRRSFARLRAVTTEEPLGGWEEHYEGGKFLLSGSHEREEGDEKKKKLTEEREASVHSE